MGCSEIPYFFCAVRETFRDIAEAYYKSGKPIPSYPEEDTVLNINWDNIPTPKGRKQISLLLLEVYIDDFIVLIHTTDQDEIKTLTCCLLHAITYILPPLL